MSTTDHTGNATTGVPTSYGRPGRRLLARIFDGLAVGVPLAILLSVLGVTIGGVSHSTLSAVVGFGAPQRLDSFFRDGRGPAKHNNP